MTTSLTPAAPLPFDEKVKRAWDAVINPKLPSF